MTLEIVVRSIALVFPLSEIVLAITKRAQPRTSRVQDRGSMAVLWVVIGFSFALGLVVQGYGPLRMRIPTLGRSLTALILLAGGMALRWVAIVTLGRFFTTDVAIHRNHTVVERGPYKYIRHPSYTGLLLSFTGMGFLLGNWLSLASMLVPIAIALLYRIRLEESALMSSLGAEYTNYCARTKRLIPGII